jgi:hypothetical protein
MPEFPSHCPRWISDIVPAKIPNVRTDFTGGGMSRLQMSAIATQGSFMAEWGGVSDKVVDAIFDFWNEVEDFEAFTLPSGFFGRGNTRRLKNRYLATSPTGLYLFGGEPTEERLSNKKFTVQVSFLGVID